MLSERQLEEVLKVFDNRMQEVTDDYIRRMGEHIRDIGRLTDSDVHRLTQMKRVNANVEAIKRAIAAAAEASMADVEAVFRAAAESDERFAETIFGEDHTPPVKISPIKTISSPLERVLKAQLRVTAQELANLSRTTLLSNAYRTAVDVAVQAVQSGLTSYDTAVRAALREAAKEGLRVEYPSGLTRRLDTAIRQNVLDGVRALNQDVLKQIGKEYGADGVEISAHALCAEDHLPYQGLQMSNKEFNRLQTLILDRPFGLWNCKHTVFPIILGVTPPAHSKEELAMYREYSTEAITIDGVTKSRYEWTQEQRRIETTIREQKHIANIYKASGDDMMRRETQRNINRLNDEYDLISRTAGLYRHPERMAVTGFHKVKTAEQLKKRTEYGTMKTFREMFSERQIVHKSEAVTSLPLSGNADTIVDLVDENGWVQQRRVYDYSGKASTDYDTSNHGKPNAHPTGAHKHVFDYSKRNPHGKPLPLTESDLRNNADIIQRGVNYSDPE